MTIKEFASRYGVSLRTIQRNVKAFNKNLPTKPDTIISNDEALYTYLLEKRGVEADILPGERSPSAPLLVTEHNRKRDDPSHRKKNVFDQGHIATGEENIIMSPKAKAKLESEFEKLVSGDLQEQIKEEENRFFNKDGSTKKVEEEEPKEAEKTEVQKALNNTSLMWFILINLLLADSVAFYVITKVTFSTVLPGSEWAFAWLGIVSGLASIVSYSRIKEDKTAEGYKYTFAVLQVVVFLSAAFSWWTLGKVTLTIMITIGFTGVITSIRHDK